jgi:hypothetical protein
MGSGFCRKRRKRLLALLRLNVLAEKDAKVIL